MSETCGTVNAEIHVSDEVLLRQLRAGDELAFETLYRRYFNYARAVAYRRVEAWDVAEDIVQEAFLFIHSNIHRYDVRAFRPWMAAVVAHRAKWARSRRGCGAGITAWGRLRGLDAMERPENYIRGLQTPAEPGEELPHTPRTLSQLATLERALPRLSASHAAVLALYRAGLSFEAIGRRLGYTTKTARVVFHDAVSRLRRLLGVARPAFVFMPRDHEAGLATPTPSARLAARRALVARTALLAGMIPDDWPSGKPWNGYTVTRSASSWLVCAGGAR